MTATESHEAQGHALYSASSVADELDLPLYRLHSWESLYPLFSAEREEKGQRYYSEHAVHIARRIAQLLYQEGVKSHEVMGRLQQEESASPTLDKGQPDHIETAVSPSSGEDAAKIAELTSTIAALRRDNDQLNTHVEEFGRIALSLKELEDQNEALSASLATARTKIRALEEAPQQEGQHAKAPTEYVAELEHNNLELQEEVESLAAQLAALKEQSTAQNSQEDTHISALRDEVAELQGELTKARQSSDRSAALEAENRALHEAQQKAEDALSEQEKAFQVRLDAALEQKHLEQQKELDALTAQLAAQKEQTAAQKDREDTHISALRDEVAELQGELTKARQSSDRYAALEAENRALHEAQQKAEDALSEQEKAFQVRLEAALEQKHLEQQKELDALTAQLTAQKDREDTHISALRDEVAELQGELTKARQSSDRYAALEAENRALHEAQQKAEGALSEQEKASAGHLETVEAERRSVVAKLEQAVLIMQSLEDENVRVKRQLKECEAAKDEQTVALEQQKALEAENADLKQRLAKLPEERENHARGLERIRSLEAEGVGLRQKLAAQAEQMHHHGERQKALDVLLHDMLGELGIMKKALTD